MNILVAVDENWGIGLKGRLLYNIPADMSRFRDMTLNRVVVMGMGTLLSLPGGLPLKDRTNIVLSNVSDWETPGAFICRSLSELFQELKRYDTNEVFVIGGQSVYKQLLRYCDKAYITKVDSHRPADAFFPNLDTMPAWRLAHKSEPMYHNELVFTFNEYVRNK